MDYIDEIAYKLSQTIAKEDENELSRLGLSYANFYMSALGTIDIHGEKDSTPPGINVDLLGHQRLLLAEMRKRESIVSEIITAKTATQLTVSFAAQNCLVLMESVGSGKSYVILSRIIQQPKLTRKFIDIRMRIGYGYNDVRQNVSSTYNTFYNTRFIERHVVGNANWIVVPHCVVHQWKYYLDNTSLTYAVFNTTKMIKDYDKFKTKEVWLVTSTKYNELVSHVAGDASCVASRMVFDECDTIDIGFVQHHPAAMMWLVSSSAQNIYHPNGDGVAAGVLSRGMIRDALAASHRSISTIIVKAPYRYVADCLRMPVVVEETLYVRNSRSLVSLTGMVPDRILNMLKANDYNSVADHYNLCIDHIIARLADTCMNGMNSDTNSAGASVAKIKDRIYNYDRCMICLDDDIKGKCITPCCLASWCMRCILNSLYTKTSCPKCRTTLLPHELMTVSATPSPSTEQVYATKKAAFEHILLQSQCGPKKILVFTEHIGGIECVKDVCKNNKLEVRELRGRDGVVKKTIANWEASSHTSVLLLNAVRYGAGLNLHKGTDVIFWHTFGGELEKSAMEQQVLGRVLRLGMTQAPKVWRILYQSE
jgi:hypothetical protein